MQFQVPRLDQFDPRSLNPAHVNGLEGIPWAGKLSTQGDVLAIERSIEESGRLQLVWPTLTRGPLLLSTSTLRCGQPPYLLPRELARGTMDKLLQRTAEWGRWGIQPPPNFKELVDRGGRNLISSIIANDNVDAASRAAQQSIEYSLAASRMLCQSFSRQVLANRHRQEGTLGTMLGGRLPTHRNWQSAAERLQPMMNVAWIDVAWHNVRTAGGKTDFERVESQLDWCRDAQLRTLGGPLISLQPHAIQEWFFVMDDFDSIVAAACEYVETVVKRFRNRIDLWYAISGFNSLNDLRLTEEQVMLLAVNVLQTVRRTDPTVPVIFGIDMPFAEYLGTTPDAISPLHFADALLRSDLGLNGVVLELNYGLWPHGTPPHDAIDLSNLLDWWASALQVPIVLSISGDIASHPSPAAGKYTPIHSWKLPVPAVDVAEMQGLVRQTNCSQLYEAISLAIAKPPVRGVFWNQPDATTPPGYESAALVGDNGVNDLVAGMINLRQRHLG